MRSRSAGGVRPNTILDHRVALFTAALAKANRCAGRPWIKVKHQPVVTAALRHALHSTPRPHRPRSAKCALLSRFARMHACLQGDTTDAHAPLRHHLPYPHCHRSLSGKHARTWQPDRHIRATLCQPKARWVFGQASAEPRVGYPTACRLHRQRNGSETYSMQEPAIHLARCGLVRFCGP